MKALSIIIVNYNLANEIDNLIESIELHVNDIDYQVIIVDNNSPDRSIEKLAPKYSKVDFIFLNTNYGFGYANNIGLDKYKSEYYLILNPDTMLTKNVPKDLIKFLSEHSEIGVVGPLIKHPNGSVQESAMSFPNIKQDLINIAGIAGRTIAIGKKIRNFIKNEKYYFCDFVFGSCMLIKDEVIREIKGFDPEFFLFFEEADFCFRVLKNTPYKVAYLRSVEIEHFGGKITNKIKTNRIKFTNESKLLFINKHYSKLVVLIMRTFNAMSLTIRLCLVPVLKKKSQWSEYYDIYFYLVVMYLKNNVVRNLTNESDQ